MVIVKIFGWLLLIIGVIMLWPLLGPLLTIALTLVGLALVLVLGALLLSVGWVVALIAIVIGLIFAAFRWALPIGVVLLGLWVLAADKKRATV